jgi:hypothetical protein
MCLILRRFLDGLHVGAGLSGIRRERQTKGPTLTFLMTIYTAPASNRNSIIGADPRDMVQVSD